MVPAAFIRALMESGRVGVDPYEPTISPNEGTETDALLRDWDADRRREFPGEAPPLLPDAARWAATQFYHACQFAVYRDLDAATLASALAVDGPESPGAAEHYTVDLVYRFLPDLLRLARSAAEGDPLCERLRQWGGQWPLSSVGMNGIGEIAPTALAAVCEHPGLLRVYVDRIIAKGDVARLADPRVRAAVRTALGIHDDLTPQIVAALKRYDESKHAEAVT